MPIYKIFELGIFAIGMYAQCLINFYYYYRRVVSVCLYVDNSHKS